MIVSWFFHQPRRMVTGEKYYNTQFPKSCSSIGNASKTSGSVYSALGVQLSKYMFCFYIDLKGQEVHDKLSPGGIKAFISRLDRRL